MKKYDEINTYSSANNINYSNYTSTSDNQIATNSEDSDLYYYIVPSQIVKIDEIEESIKKQKDKLQSKIDIWEQLSNHATELWDEITVEEEINLQRSS